MYNNRTNIKIKLDDKVLEKVNKVDKAVEDVAQLYEDFDAYKNQVDMEVNSFEQSIDNKVEEFENDVNEEINNIDNKKQDKLIAGDYIRIDESSEGPIISSIGGTWDDIEDKPTINGVTLEGGRDYTTNDLHTELGISKAEAMFYDEYGELDKEGKKYWYMSTNVNGINEGATEALPYLILDSEGNPIPYDFGKGGGGGGGGADTDIKISAVDYPPTVSLGTSCKVIINWSSLKDEQPTGAGSISVLVNGVTKYTRNNVPQGNVTFDIGNYLVSGTNKVSFIVTDAYENQSRIVIMINAIEIELTSTFDPDRVFTQVINYTYTPIAAVPKIMYFYVDGELYGTEVVTVTGEQQTYQITGLTHGAHSLDVYFTCVVDESEVQSNTLSYDLMFAIEGDPTPIISSTFTALEQEQYVTFNIPYRVYTPGYNYSNIDLIIDDEVVQSLTVNQDTQYWEYRSSNYGIFDMTIKTEDVERSFIVKIDKSEINVQPVTANLGLYLTSYGRSNAEAHPEIWEDADNHISCTLSDFNFSSNGWVKDDEGNTVLRLNGDARVDIPYQPFKADFRTLGKTIEIEFATSIVKDYEAKIISCWSGDRGIYITPQLALIKSQQSELQTQYKEDDHVRLAFVIEKTSESHLILMYINGIMSGAVQYPLDDNFRQLTPVNITLGSNDATLDIYNIRVYNNNLNRKQVVNNWIADTQNGDLKAQRYYNNDVFNESGSVVASKLPTTTPYIIWDIDPLPQYKGDKRKGQAYYKDQINTMDDFKLPLDDEGNPTGEYNVQGTSSAVYPVKNIRLKSKKGFVSDDGTVRKLFYITPDGIGANYFTFKVDYASSEGANNVELVRLYNDSSKKVGVLTPPQKQDSRVRVGIDGFPVVAFHRDSQGNDSFTTKANFNNDKANEDVYGFADGDESWEITNNSADEAKFKKPVTPETFVNAFEIRYPDIDDYSDISKLGPMTEWVCSTDPEQATNDPLDEPIQFVYSTVVRAEDGSYNTKIVTTDLFEIDSAEYRKSKFKAELKDWFNINSTVFYYIFTHLFLMVDSRAKNAFPTYFASREPGDGGNHWFWLPYDMDTALGINNEGKLVFNYNLEDIDQIDGADVFNGQNSVIWCNLREMFDGEIGQMYAELRKSGNLVNFDEVEDRFIKHQSTWPENVFNEDSYEKYIIPLLKEGNNYLEMLQGSKAEQRRWWLYNRFKYFDSKYLAGDAKIDVLQFRAYDVADITITPYADIYAAVSYMNGAAGTVSVRAEHDKSYTLHNPLTYANDQETYIYSASQLKSVGDLSPFKPDTVKAANAVKLQELKVGDGDPNYFNPNLKELTLGKNILLNSLDIRNCINLTQSVDISNCTNIEHIYFDGTKITGLALPVGGIIKTLHLPDTMTNITIRNQPQLTDLQIAGTSKVQTLWLENIPFDTINAMGIIRQMPEGAAVRLVGFEDHVESVGEIRDAYDLLDTMTGINAQGEDVPTAQVNGKIYIDTISYADYTELSARYIDIKIVANHILCTVTFYNEGEEYEIQIVEIDHAATTPVDPTKPSTAQYYYVFEGWDKDFNDVKSDMDIYATYSEHIQVYEFKFNTQTDKIHIEPQSIPYGEVAVRPRDPELPGSTFEGWFNEPNCINEYDFDTLITGPKEIYAKWIDYEKINVSITRTSFDSFDFEITDNVAVIKYAITNSDEEPEEWIDITPTEDYNGHYQIDSVDSFYVWGSDAAGNTDYNVIRSYIITKNVSTGASVLITEDSVDVDNFALEGTELLIEASKDDHYDNLRLYVDDSLVDNPYAKFINNSVNIEVTCEPHVYTVQFDIGEYGEPVPNQYITYQDRAIEPTPQFDEGMIVDGWLLNGEQFDFDTQINEDITLVANWIEYIAPTKLTVNADSNDEITVNFTLNNNSIAKINFGDGSDDVRVSALGKNSVSHIYEEAGVYIIELTCEQGSHLLGYDILNTCVVPSNKLINVEFSYNMATTNQYAFAGSSLTNVVITDYMTSIAGYAFKDCKDLANVHISNNIKVIGTSAFNGDSKLENINLPDTITSIGSFAFSECRMLTDITIPSALAVLRENAFADTGIISIDIPETVETIEDKVFQNCFDLRKVIIRNSNIICGSQIFNSCTLLETVGPLGGDYDVEINYGLIVPAHLLEMGTSIEYSNIKSVTLPDNIEKIGDFAFANNMKLVNINLPDTLTEIGDSSFVYCQSLRLSSLPQSLVRIGDDAFNTCFVIDINEIPSGVTYIGSKSFRRCIGIISISIPFSVLYIGDLAFQNCLPLRNAYIHCTSSENKVNTFNVAWFNNCSSLLLLHIPRGLDVITAKEVFGDCWNFYGNGLTLNYEADLD